MLILTIRAGEKLIISDDICITVLDIKDKQVHIGIGKPKDIAINRNMFTCEYSRGNKKHKESSIE